MRRLLLLLIFLSPVEAQVVPGTANAKTDKYGGLLGYPCVGVLKGGGPIPGASGFFYLYKDTVIKRWLWCDPEGYRYFLIASSLVQATDPGGKYGAYQTATSPFASQSRRLWDAGFNALGEFGSAHMEPIPQDTNTNKLPYMQWISPAHYATTVGNTRLHDIFANLPPAYDAFGGYRAYRSVDLYDPKWLTFLNTAVPATLNAEDANPWLLSITEDDVAYVAVAYAYQSIWMVGATPPWVQYENSYGFGTTQVFSDPVMYSKQQWATWLCGTRYANLAALNAAWGSTYSTCGSSATTAAAETIGTGDGVATSFSYTFLHGPVDEASIGIKVGGVLDGGDCPWFNSNVCPGGVGTGGVQGNVASKNINGGTVTYKSGGAACGGQAAPCITVTFSAAPANGVAITATYQYGGWPKATSGGTGLLDEDGTSTWYPTTYVLPDPAVTTIERDMDAFLPLLLAQYYSPIRTNLNVAYPHHVLVSTDPVQLDAERNSALTATATYVDLFFTSYDPSGASAATATAAYNLTGTPQKVAIYLNAQADSPFYAYAGGGFNPALVSQNDKGNYYAGVVNAANALAGTDGYIFTSGVELWAWQDNNSEKANWGLTDLNDNVYDGVETGIATIVDPYGFRTVPNTAIPHTGYSIGVGDGVTTTFNVNVKLLPIKPSTFTITQSSYAQSATDNFTRANANPIGGNWTTDPSLSALQIVSNSLRATASGDNGAYYNAVVWPNDQYCELTIAVLTSGADNVTCAVRQSAVANTEYLCYGYGPLGSAVTLAIGKTIAGAFTGLVSTTHSFNSGDVLRCEAQGTSLVLKLNGTIVLTTTDSSIAAGNVAIQMHNADAQITNWNGGSIPAIVGTDDGNGNITGTGISSGTIQYTAHGTLSITYSSPPSNASPITAAFTQNGFGGYQPSYVPIMRTTHANTMRNLASGSYSILSTNLALEKPAMFTSATEVLQAKSFKDANDGDIATSWQPSASNPQTYRIDLLGKPSISKAILRWGAVYATAYTLDWSDDGISWTTAFTQAAGAGGVETDTFTAVSHRYWRMNETTRSGAGSLALQEMELYEQ